MNKQKVINKVNELVNKEDCSCVNFEIEESSEAFSVDFYFQARFLTSVKVLKNYDILKEINELTSDKAIEMLNVIRAINGMYEIFSKGV